MKNISFTDKDFISEIDSYLRDNLSQGRYEHSLSTANTCRILARMFSFDQDKAFFAGLVHDIAREYPEALQLEYAARDGKPISEVYRKFPLLLHGRAGAAVLEEKFGIGDTELLDAVRTHTTGDRNMSQLGKILFVADYIEPKRKHITPAFLKKLEKQSLDKMVRIVLLGTIGHLEKQGKIIAPEAFDLLRELDNEE